MCTMDTSMIGAYFPGWSSQKVVNSKGILPNTVDGRNPANQLRSSLSHYLQGFSTIPGGCLGFLPSTVVRESSSQGNPNYPPQNYPP